MAEKTPTDALLASSRKVREAQQHKLLETTGHLSPSEFACVFFFFG
jgi:hypothetical protein